MAICRYFLNGNCRFGANCRFEHADPYHNQGNKQYRDVGRGELRKNDNYHWQKGNDISGSEIERMFQAIREEVIALENGNMWPFTCFAPIPRNGNFPGWEDHSPEELHLEMIKAFQNGTGENYKTVVESLRDSYREKRSKLKMSNRETNEVIREYLKSTPESNQNFSSNTGSVFKQSSSVFGGNTGSSQSFSFASAFSSTPSQPQAATNSFSFAQAFNQPGSVFGGQSKQQGSIFGGQSTSSSSGVFGQTQAPAQSTSIFAQTQAVQQASFGQSASVFGQNQANQSVNTFGQNQTCVFGTPNSSVPAQSGFGNSFSSSNNQNNLFQTSAPLNSNSFQQNTPAFPQNSAPSSFQSQFNSANTGFNQANNFQASANPMSNSSTSSIYSPLDSLTQEELEAYKQQTFTFKHIPLTAPPESLCH